jgi:hypothetical protein
MSPSLHLRAGAIALALAAHAGAGRADSPPAAVGNGEELLSNHDFSSAKKDAGFPDKWHRKPWMTWESAKDFHFLRLSTTKPSGDISAWRDLGLPPGVKAVQIAVRYRTNGITPYSAKDSGVRASFVFLDAMKIKFTPPPEPLELQAKATDWIVSTAKIPVPENATTLWFSIGMFQVQAGTLDLADVSVTAIPAADAPAPTVAKGTALDNSVPIRREGAHTIIGYGVPKIWLIHPYVDVLGHDFDMGISHLVQEAREQGLSIAVGVAGKLDDTTLSDEKNTTYVFSYKNINYPLPNDAHRMVFLNTWLLPEVKWPVSRAGKKDVVLLGTKTLHNNGDGLATNKDRWWLIQKDDPSLSLIVLDGDGYFLPISVWRSALLKLILEDSAAKP